MKVRILIMVSSCDNCNDDGEDSDDSDKNYELDNVIELHPEPW